MSISWVAQEMLDPDLGDARLDARLITLLEALAAQPTASIPQACGNWAATKAAYRFIGSHKVTPQALRDAHHGQVLGRAHPHARLLAIQDTTDLDFRSQPCMQGIGPTGTNSQQGLLVHSVLLTSAEGLPLGLLWQQVWAREAQKRGQSKQARQRALPDKESYKWIAGLQATQQTLPPDRSCLVVGDREADLYALFVAPRGPNTALLVRAAYDRRISQEAHRLYTALKAAPVAGIKTLEVPAREGKPARQALLSVRFTSVELVAPCYVKEGPATVAVQALEAWEAHPPDGLKPLRWVLLTTLPLLDFADACACLVWYSYRWLIEQYHYILKSGCRIEALQLESAVRLQVALALYCIVAWRLLWLTYLARQQPDLPCNEILETHEWQALYSTLHRNPKPPSQPPSLREAVRWIAQLGGFLGRKGDGEPGVQTLWRGMQRLQDIAQTWKLLHPQDTYG